MVERRMPGEVAARAVDSSRATINEWVGTFELFADPTRMKILVAVHAAPQASVSEIATATGISPNTVTQALATLQTAGVVASRKDGRYRRWTLTDDAAHQVLHHMKAPHTPLHPDTRAARLRPARATGPRAPRHPEQVPSVRVRR